MKESRKISAELTSLGQRLRSGEEKAAQSDLFDLIDELGRYVEKTAHLNEDEKGLQELLRLLQTALTAQERKDWIELGDIFEFELAPLLTKYEPDGGEASP